MVVVNSDYNHHETSFIAAAAVFGCWLDILYLISHRRIIIIRQIHLQSTYSIYLSIIIYLDNNMIWSCRYCYYILPSSL